jgi:hypothetical protein
MCGSREWTPYLVFGVLGLCLYILGYPLSLFLLLKNRDKIFHEEYPKDLVRVMGDRVELANFS